MMGRLRILLTGATGGLGAALVREYAAPGVKFLLLGRDPERLQAVRAIADDAGAQATSLRLDADDSAGFLTAVNDFTSEGGLDLVLLAAGVKTGNVDGVEPAGQASRVIDVNLTSVIDQVEAVLPLLRSQASGKIVLFSSLAALAPQPDLLSYSASKAALRAYGTGLRRVLRGTGVSVHVVSPGFVDTPMTDRHHGRTPMKISAEKAAQIIRRGLDRGTPFIAFPGALVLLVRLQNLLPVALSDWLDQGFRARIEPDKDEMTARANKSDGK